MESYRRIRSEERETTLVLVENGKNQADIAKALGRNQSSLPRELAKGLEKGAYNPFLAQREIEKRAADGASIFTDKTKYAFGEQMVISGIGFTPDGTVTVTVLRPGIDLYVRQRFNFLQILDEASRLLPADQIQKQEGLTANWPPIPCMQGQ